VQLLRSASSPRDKPETPPDKPRLQEATGTTVSATSCGMRMAISPRGCA